MTTPVTANSAGQPGSQQNAAANAPPNAPPNALWQAGRWMPALDPGSYRLDDRDIDDLAHWAVGFAGLLVYFDADNRAVHPGPNQPPIWADFFAADITFLLAQISCTTPTSDYRQAQKSTATTEKAIAKELQQLAYWRRRAETLSYLAPPDSLEAEFYGIIERASENELYHAVPKSRKTRASAETETPPEAWFDDGTDSKDADALYSLLNRVTGQIVARAKIALRTALSQKSNHPPQTALFLAFLILLRQNQVDLNGLTERHLNFYYDKVLRLVPRPAHPDRARLSFELAPESPDVELPPGTALIAGSASVPNPTVFLTDHALRINRITLAQISTVSVSRTVLSSTSRAPEVKAIRCYPNADSADGFGAPLPPGTKAWPPFGPASTAPKAQAKLGIGLVAPVLAMTQGTRNIKLTLTFQHHKNWTLIRALTAFAGQVSRKSGEDFNVDTPLLPDYVMQALRLAVLSGDDTIALEEVSADLRQAHRDRLILRGVVPADAPALVAATGYDAPMLTMTLNPDAPIYGYDLLAKARVKKAQIDVSVTGMRTLELSGPFGPVDPKKPFAPFGLAPKPGDALFLSNPELTRDTLRDLRMTLDWTGLPVPPETFESHYKAYNTGLTGASFQLRISRSDGEAWYPLWPTKDLTTGTLTTGKLTNGTLTTGTRDPADGPPPPEADLMPLFTLDAPPTDAVSDQSIYKVSKYQQPHQRRTGTVGAAQRPGAIKLEFTAPPEGFGQTLYPALVAKVAIINAQPWWARLKLPKGLKSGLLMVPPEPPLLPLVAAMSADYTASQQSAELTDAGSAIRLYQFNPLGAVTPSRDGRVIGATFDFDGMLLLGLDGVDPPDTVTLLIDIGDLVARPWVAGNGFARPNLSWMYFDGTHWHDLEGDAVEMDETGGLVTHGIVRLALPLDIAPGPQYPGGLCWLGVMVDGDTSCYGEITQILPQAVSATRQIKSGTDPDGRPELPAGSIARLAVPQAAIKAITQPYGTEGGRAAETTQQFRLRVSERLSHKHRAILPRDYERLVLEAFPDIGQVSCLTRRPGQVDLVVSPLRKASRTSGPLPEVPLHQRLEIAAWIKQYTNETALTVQVFNPQSEAVQVRALVVPGRGASSALIHSVEQEINRIIAPWLLDPALPMPVGTSRLDPATLRARIEKMPGVDRLWALSVQQVYRLRGSEGDTLYGFKDTARRQDTAPHSAAHAGWTSNADRSLALGIENDAMSRAVLRGATPWSVLVPAQTHQIRFMQPRHGIGDLTVGQDLLVTPETKQAAYMANPGLIPASALPVGIGQMAIGADFILTDPQDAIAPHDAAIVASPVSEQTLLMPLSELD